MLTVMELAWQSEEFKDYNGGILKRATTLEHMGVYTLMMLMENGEYDALSAPAQLIVTNKTAKGAGVITQLFTPDMAPALEYAYGAEIIDGFWYPSQPLRLAKVQPGTVRSGYLSSYDGAVDHVLRELADSPAWALDHSSIPPSSYSSFF
jgi:hypothetical protein